MLVYWWPLPGLISLIFITTSISCYIVVSSKFFFIQVRFFTNGCTKLMVLRFDFSNTPTVILCCLYIVQVCLFFDCYWWWWWLYFIDNFWPWSLPDLMILWYVCPYVGYVRFTYRSYVQFFVRFDGDAVLYTKWYVGWK